jgi:hypothetical protein
VETSGRDQPGRPPTRHEQRPTALEALVGAGADEDRSTVAEAQGGADLPLLVPQGGDARLDLGQLRLDRLAATGAELMPELGAALAEAVDLLLDLWDCSHVE